MSFSTYLSSSLCVFDLRQATLDLMSIENRRFMYHGSGILILGSEDMVNSSHGLFKSHAEEYGEVSERFGVRLPPYDEFARGWIGVGGSYPNGIIHFAPHIVSTHIPYFNTAFDFIESAVKNGFSGHSILRGFCEPWEQPLSNVLPEVELIKEPHSMNKTHTGVRDMNSRKWFLEVVQDFDGTYYANMVMNGKPVTGLPEYVNYNTLRDAIRQQTGVVILNRSQMKFQGRGRKKYAYIDNTQERPDCRVTLREMDQGWKPDFSEGKKPSLDQQIKSAGSRAANAASAGEKNPARDVPER